MHTAIMDRDPALLPVLKDKLTKSTTRLFGSDNLKVPIQALIVTAS
jgi:hypothetical protein